MVVEKKGAENIVFVGTKPVMNYVLAVITQFNQGVSEVVLKARGRDISRAVDVAEAVRNRFVQGVNVGSINIGTEEALVEGGGQINISAIKITLKRS